MTGIPVRTTKFASWFDPDAWMEKMRGPKWEDILKEEASNANRYLKSHQIQKRTEQCLTEYKAVSHLQPSMPFYYGVYTINWHNNFFKTWKVLGAKETHTARAVLPTDQGLYCTEDVGKGAEEFQLQYWADPFSTKPTWTKGPVGPDIGLVGDKLFYLGVENKLIYHKLYMCDAKTGVNEKCIYAEKNPETNLAIELNPDGQVVLVAETSQRFKYFQIQETGTLTEISSPKHIPSTWIQPIMKQHGIDWIWPNQGIVITKHHGDRTLWKLSSRSSAKKLLHIPAGDIQIDPIAAWHGVLPALVCVSEPTGISYYKLSADEFELVKLKEKTSLHSERIEARSAGDYKPVFGCLTYDTTQKPKALLAIGYGAYGMTTAVGPVLTRWAPLVRKGWAILYTFLRGGGDHTEEWAHAGQRSGRQKTFEDFEGLVIEAQQQLNLPASKTAIYGRSAGGFLMGATLGNHPNGTLAQCIYTEVPYVDVLRTTTNPELPLTRLEFNEFGNPVVSLEDFIFNSLYSPADTATVVSTPNVFVLARTASHDSQVFTYEPLKWIRRLRSNAPIGAPKICIVDRDNGHFTPPDLTLKQWSADCALLEAWLYKDLPSIASKNM